MLLLELQQGRRINQPNSERGYSMANLEGKAKSTRAKKTTTKATAKKETLTEDQIDNIIDETFNEVDKIKAAKAANSKNSVGKEMFDRYSKGDKVREIIADYCISKEAFYREIKPYQDAEAGIVPEVKDPAPVKEVKTKSSKKTSKAKTETTEISKPSPGHSQGGPESTSKEDPKPATKKGKENTPAPTEGVFCWRKTENGTEYVKTFTKTKGKRADNEVIKRTTDRKEAKVWRTMYAAVDFLCKREKVTKGWNISHK
jgi:cell division septation protein DedD